MSLHAALLRRAAQNRPIRVGLIGAGKFGSMYLSQVPRTPGVHLAGIADLSPEGARRNLARVGWESGRTQARSLDEAFKTGGTWITEGFDALEALLAADTRRGAFCVGDAPTLADVYLVPQVESARRFKVDLARWPLIAAVEAACMQLPAFQKAAPSQQPDAA